MKRIAVLLCLALIGSLLHAAVGSGATAAPSQHRVIAIAPGALGDTVSIGSADVTHHHHLWSMASDASEFVPGVHHSSNTPVDQESTACHSFDNECCLGTAMPPAPAPIAVATASGIATVVAMSIPAGRVRHGIYKPPRS